MFKFEDGETISEATLRDSDLLEAMVAALERAGCDDANVISGREHLTKLGDFGYIGNMYVKMQADGIDKVTASNLCMDIDWLINESLPDLLQGYAPDGCYFGAHPGDGALIGFWKMDEED